MRRNQQQQRAMERAVEGGRVLTEALQNGPTRFGQHLRAARQRKGLSLRALAGLLGVSAPYIHDVECVRRGTIAPDRWPVLAKALGVTVGAIEAWAENERCPTCGGPLPRSAP